MNRQHKYRLLILAPKCDYINPTESVFLNSLETYFDVVRYGPGYVPLHQLKDDAQTIYEELGPFDAAIVHQYFLFDTIEGASRSCHLSFNLEGFLHHHNGFPQNITKLSCPLFALLLRMDTYALTGKHIYILDVNRPGIAGDSVS